VSGGLRLQLTSSGQGRRAGGCWHVVCTAHPESNKFQIIVADAVVTPPPTQVVCFRKAGRPTSFLSEGFKTAGRFHRLCSLFAGHFCWFGKISSPDVHRPWLLLPQSMAMRQSSALVERQRVPIACRPIFPSLDSTF